MNARSDVQPVDIVDRLVLLRANVTMLEAQCQELASDVRQTSRVVDLSRRFEALVCTLQMMTSDIERLQRSLDDRLSGIDDRA